MAKLRFETQDVPRFSPRWWFSAARNFLWVAIVTLLVWIYADMEVAVEEKVTLTVRLTTGNAQDLMLLSKPEHKVTFTVRGSRVGLKEFTSEYGNTVIDYDVSKKYELGKDQAIPTAEILHEATDVVRRGLEVLSPLPSTIAGVHLDRRVHHVVPVEFVYSDAELEEEPKANMGVTLGESQWREILREQPEPVLKTVRKNLINEKTGEPITVKAEIIPSIAGVDITPDRESIEVRITIKQRTGEKPIQITVGLKTPTGWPEEGGIWKEYDFKRKDELDWRKEILVTGPTKDLARLDPANVDAYIVLKEDDKKPIESWLKREVIIRFPEDVKVKLAGGPPFVEFKLEKIQPVPPK